MSSGLGKLEEDALATFLHRFFSVSRVLLFQFWETYRWSRAPPTPAAAKAAPSETVAGRKPRKHKHRGNRKENGKRKSKHRVDEHSVFLKLNGFSTFEHANVSSDGWQGRLPPKRTEEALRASFDDGSIKSEIAKNFLPVPYDHER